VRLRLVVPIDVDTPTGGNVYDLAVADALQHDGDEVEVVRCDPSTLSAVLEQPWSGFTLVDGLLACPAPQIVANAPVGVLVHMPLALETGLPPDRATRLDELEGRALRAATKVVTTSHWSAQYLAEHHGVHDVAVAPPGVEPAAISEGSDPPLFVQLAALLPHKDQLSVVAALTEVQDLSWRARLAGSVDRDPDYTAAVRSAVKAAGLRARLEITGVMDRDAAWSGADLALLPSRVEAFGMVVTEALARGIPAIVSQGGPVEALGVTTEGERPGVVVPAGDLGALARELRRWLTDDQHRNDLRARALSRRRTLDGWETTARRIRSALAGA
jgi:glycosyltransferase involved in cell wall biosynthesis